MTRVVVIGAGIGGCLAALAAKAKDESAAVTLLSTSAERFQYESGTIDVLGYTDDKTGPIERPLFEMRTLPEDHPYSLVGVDGVRNALEFFDDYLENDETLPYLGNRAKNVLLPTLNGNVRPTARYPEGLAGGVASSQEQMHIVGFEQVTHLDAELAGDRLDETAPYDVNWTTVEFPIDPTSSPPLLEIAELLDENRETPNGEPVRKALADTVRPELDIEPRVGFPAVLGLNNHTEVRRELESLLHADVFEIPAGEPSLPGLRLREQLFELVDASGIERTDAAAIDVEADGDTIRKLHVDRGASQDERETIEGDSFVLATGDVAAGGLVGTGDDVVEPVFDCPVTVPDTRLEWSVPAPLGDHPFARFGVDVSEELQPVTTAGEPVFENLYAAGTVIGGHNFVREHSRGGVAVVTGYEAGRRAIE